jgi:hypothetical protein
MQNPSHPIHTKHEHPTLHNNKCIQKLNINFQQQQKTKLKECKSYLSWQEHQRFS